MKQLTRITRIALVLIVLSLAVNVAAAQEPPVCSISSDSEAYVVLTNGSNFLLDFYWVNYECVEEYYGTLAPDESVVLPTFATHPWVMRRSDTGLQVGETVVSEFGEPVVFEAACSLDSMLEMELAVANYSDSPALLSWVDYDCVEQPGDVIASGSVSYGTTYDSHVFILRDQASGKIIRTIRAEGAFVPAQ